MFEEQFQALLPRAREATAGLSAGQLNWRPERGSWSIAQCFAHLNTTDEHYCRAIESSIQQARRKGWPVRPNLKLGMIERFLLSTIEPPFQRKFRAPKAFAPDSETYDRDELLARWISNRNKLLELAGESDGVDVLRTRVASPASSLFRFSLLFALQAVAAHDRRHLWQIDQIRGQLPGALTRSAT